MTHKAWRIFDAALHGLITALVASLAVIGILQVFFRYVVQNSLAWTEETSRILLIWLVLLAAAAEVQRGSHIAMRLVVDKLSPSVRPWVERLSLVLIFCFGVVMLVYGLQLATHTMAQSATTLPIRMGEIYLALPLSGLIIAVNAARQFRGGYGLQGIALPAARSEGRAV